MERPKAFVISFLVGIFAVGLGAEATYRYWLYASGIANPIPTIATFDVPPAATQFANEKSIDGPYIPGRNFTFRMYGPTGTLDRTIRVGINSTGWVSQFEYTLTKQPGEYRIAIIGDSLTASITNEKPWPDIVQANLSSDRELLRTIGAQSISVLNIASLGASYKTYRSILAPKARRFGADLLVINLAPETAGLIEPTAAATARASKLVINDIMIPLGCFTPVPFYEDCQASPVWYVPPGEPLSPETIMETQRASAQQMRAKRLLSYPLPLLLTAGATFPQGPTLSPIVSADLQTRATVFEEMRSGFSSSIAVLNPLPWHFEPPGSESVRKFTADMKTAGVELIDSRQFLPFAKDRSGWYNMPHDAHWSDKGAEVYGKAVATIIKRSLSATQRSHLPTSEAATLRHWFAGPLR